MDLIQYLWYSMFWVLALCLISSVMRVVASLQCMCTKKLSEQMPLPNLSTVINWRCKIPSVESPSKNNTSQIQYKLIKKPLFEWKEPALIIEVFLNIKTICSSWWECKDSLCHLLIIFIKQKDRPVGKTFYLK